MAQPLASSSTAAPSCFPRRPSSSSSSPRRAASSSWPPPRCRRAVAAAALLHLGPGEIAELARNKVLIAATVASTIGQLAKPFISGDNGVGGRRLDLRTALRSGGMPSTHSAGVVAVATSLGLERGFADSVFGMSVVFAAIVMYDAQGVRREVGNHAKVLNKYWTLRDQLPQSSELISIHEAISSSRSNNSPSPRRGSRTESSSRLNVLQTSEPEAAESAELKQAHIEEGYDPFSESVGHTELQVAAGAALGFVVSLAVYATL